jgi:hypothetical protein
VGWRGRLFWEYREALGYNFERAGLPHMAGDLWPERVRGLRGSAWYRFYEIRRFDIDPDLADSTIVPGRNRVASVAGSLTWDLRDAPLDPHRGSLNFASFETAADQLGGNVNFVKGRLETAWAFSWLPAAVLALAARLGLAAPFGGSTDLHRGPLLRGRGQHRAGYREQRGPLDAQGDPTGGNALVVSTRSGASRSGGSSARQSRRAAPSPHGGPALAERVSRRARRPGEHAGGASALRLRIRPDADPGENR